MTETLLQIAKDAGSILLNLYNKPISVEWKQDESPVTQADVASSAFIRNALKSSAIPVLCEEAEVPYSTRKQWSRFWLIDPLDGTKEFIKGTDEFTVNIALVEFGRPTLGVVYAPALGLMAWAEHGKGAWQMGKDGTPLRLDSTLADPFTGVRSRSHDSPEIDRFYALNGVTRDTSIGSSLKFLKVADGSAGLYARFTGSKEWDTAAGQVILIESGGWILGNETRQALRYNKPDLGNELFIAGAGNLNPEGIKWTQPRRPQELSS